MTSVKADSCQAPDDERHVLRQLGVLMDEVRHRLHRDGSTALRASHHRVIGHVPREGISVTDLAERVGMTKQGCGQFVTQLVDSGHLETRPDPEDRRVRLVLRTTAGRREARDLVARLADLEDRVGGRGRTPTATPVFVRSSTSWPSSVGERVRASLRWLRCKGPSGPSHVRWLRCEGPGQVHAVVEVRGPSGPSHAVVEV